MTDFAALLQADRGQPAHVVHLVDKGNVEDWLKRRSADDRALLAAHRFDGKSAHAFAVLPRGKDVFEAVAAVAKADRLSPWCLAKLASALPEGVYRLAEGDPGPAALGWLLAQHRLDS
jgi:leucyl aminopeptidase